MAVTVAECDAMIDGVRAAGVLLTVNKITRYRDVAQRREAADRRGRDRRRSG